MLLELAIGDAYGAGFEFAEAEFVRQYNDLTAYRQHPRHHLKPGSYTDDTQMSMAIAETLINQEPWTPQVLAERFVRTFKRDPREGYATRFYAFLQQVEDGETFLAQIGNTSEKSGAAMRVSPVGILPTLEQVLHYAKLQAAITHNTELGMNAACAAALMSHYFIYQLGEKRDLGQFLESHVSGNWNTPWQGEVGTLGWMCVQAAVTAVMRNDSMCAILQDCVAFTGDVDTVGAIALAAASCSVEVTQDLPHHLIEGLENGSYGRDYLIQLDRQLISLVLKNS
ncbi:MAG: ADP-ribosylglycohydrolase family protein [Desertifilum sp. SIO1I2]|nr:ADP-ribosylglycohydrolase family protein [Desertifilum sp. SIO1I2]